MSSLGRFAVVAAAWLVFVSPAAADAPEVKDEGKFFSAEAIKKANEVIREIYKKYEQDLLVETYATVPGGAEEAEKVKKMTAEERSSYFKKWAAKRADDAALKGVIILICKDPATITPGCTSKAQKIFDLRARTKLKSDLSAKFKEKKFDDGLLDLVKYVNDSYKAGKAVVAPEVKDPGKFFSAEAIKKANEIISEIYAKSKTDLVIETIPAVPGDEEEVAKVKKMSRTDKFEYFRKLNRKRIETLKIKGIYILVCKNPTFLKIDLSEKSPSDSEKKIVSRLEKILLDEFREKRFDEGLIAAVKYVREALVK
jgi:hypothetical protein